MHSVAAFVVAASAAVVVASSGGAAGASSARPCFDSFNTLPFETPCYTTLANASGGALTVRAYDGADAAARLVSYAAPASVSPYQEALMLTSFYVIDYFVNKSLGASRTVPLTLRPPSTANAAWLAQMTLAPSKWPPASKPPVPLAPTALVPRGKTTLASLRTIFEQPPQPSDFDGLCAQLRAGVQVELKAWVVDDASPVSPTHARYYGELWDGPWEAECWVGVKSV